ncbi:MAG: efflux RND transporter permease subunit [Sandaracinaceae bacterium]
MIERLVALCVRRRRTVLVVVLLLTAVAAWRASHLQLDALPDVTPNQVVVLTRAPGFTPGEVERLVTRPVETSLGALPGLSDQRSISRYGLSAVINVFEDGVDPYLARQLVQERLATLGSALPAGVEAPEMGPHTGGLGEIYHFTLESPSRSGAALLELARFRVAPLLRAVPGVVEVNSWGGEERTYDVVADPERLVARGVGLEELGEAVGRATGAAPGAALPAGPAHVLLRGLAWPEQPADLAPIVIRQDPRSGAAWRVADVATTTLGARTRIGAATADGGGEVVYGMVQMLRGANALEVMEGVHQRMAVVREVLPEDVVLTEVYDRSELVHATLRTVAENLGTGGLLVVVILLLTLGDLRAGLLVASVIPLSMLGAAVGMVTLGVPGNLMSLGALDFGLLVDGAVVMVESVFARTGAIPREDRVLEASQAVARPVVFSVLVIALVYVPVLGLTGADGRMFRPMALTVVLALATSLVLAVTWIPAGAATLLGSASVPDRPPWLIRVAQRGYAPLLAWSLAHPWTVTAVAALALAGGGVLFARAGSTFVPQLEEGDLVIQTRRAPDISLETAVDEAGRLETALIEEVPEVRHVVSRIGSPAVATDIMGIEQADVFVDLVPRDRWRPGLTRGALLREIDDVLARRAPTPSVVFTQPIQMRFNEILGGSVSDVAVAVYGEDLGELRSTADRLVSVLGEVEGAADVQVDVPPAVQLLDVRPRSLEAAAWGLSPAEVLTAVQAVRSGVVVGQTYDGPVSIPIRLRTGTDRTAFDLGRLPVVAPGGVPVPLDAVADLELKESPAAITHHEAQRRLVVGFNVRGRDLGTVVADARAAVADRVDLASGQRLDWGGQVAQLEEARTRLAVIVPVVLLVIFGILVWLFRSLLPTALIFLNVPFAAVGGIGALSLRGLPVSISAAVGFVALSGIAVLNGVVLMSRLRELEAEGRTPRAAAEEAATKRLRPVLMTASVAAFGFVPMALATGIGAEVQRPLATVVVGGLVTSTLLTLLLLPTVYAGVAGRLLGDGSANRAA